MGATTVATITTASAGATTIGAGTTGAGADAKATPGPGPASRPAATPGAIATTHPIARSSAIVATLARAPVRPGSSRNDRRVRAKACCTPSHPASASSALPSEHRAPRGPSRVPPAPEAMYAALAAARRMGGSPRVSKGFGATVTGRPVAASGANPGRPGMVATPPRRAGASPRATERPCARAADSGEVAPLTQCSENHGFGADTPAPSPWRTYPARPRSPSRARPR